MQCWRTTHSGVMRRVLNNQRRNIVRLTLDRKGKPGAEPDTVSFRLQAGLSNVRHTEHPQYVEYSYFSAILRRLRIAHWSQGRRPLASLVAATD